MLSVLLGLLPVVPDVPNILSGTLRCSQISYNHSHGTPVLVITDPMYSKCLKECPPRVRHSPEIDTSNFILLIFADPIVGFQWQKNILLMYILSIVTLIPKHSRVANNRTRCTVYIWWIIITILNIAISKNVNILNTKRVAILDIFNKICSCYKDSWNVIWLSIGNSNNHKIGQIRCIEIQSLYDSWRTDWDSWKQ
jgi:hypothetical protein